jgi:hypothetical protein
MGLLSLSFHYNSETKEKESCNYLEITSLLLRSYRLAGSSRFTLANSGPPPPPMPPHAHTDFCGPPLLVMAEV